MKPVSIDDEVWGLIYAQRDYMSPVLPATARGQLLEQLANVQKYDPNKVENLDETKFEAIKKDLWRNNNRPNPCAKKTLDGLLDRVTDEIAEMDTDLLNLQLDIEARLEKMKKIAIARREKNNKAETYRALPTAVRLLPPEILVLIFKYALFRVLDGYDTVDMSPLTLSSVCFQWREAVLGFPTLCNDLAQRASNFEYGFNYDAATGDLCFSLKTDKGYQQRTARTLVKSIIPFHPSITELSFDLYSFDDIFPLLVLPGGSFPLLKKLFIYSGDESSRTKRRGLAQGIQVFRGTRSLRNVTLDLGHHDVRPFLETLPWAQIAHLHLPYQMPLSLVIKILSKSQQLHNLSFVVDAQDPAIMPIENPIQFPHLETLNITICAKDKDKTDFKGRALPGFFLRFAEVLSNLELPKLQNLAFACNIRSDFPNPLAILPSMQPWVSPLRRLGLMQNLISASQLTDLLSPCIGLELLAICPDDHAESDPVALLRALSPVPNNPQSIAFPHSFPHLTSFAAMVVCHSSEESSAIAMQFGALIREWVQDVSRVRPLESASLFIFDKKEENHDAHQVVLEKLRVQLSSSGGSGLTLDFVVGSDAVMLRTRVLGLTKM
ncbi:hypothetical protein H0H81_001283 [Sphagnurus paluster]|uniref:F-box domain-containing protein n=1 Tax=Sphagnurus paluster TaxID=117069 RepID=A0A9P7KHN2_9AGAR|nr:hypothetical protein H0H81_001283 [Sphagnurus paluster]